MGDDTSQSLGPAMPLENPGHLTCMAVSALIIVVGLIAGSFGYVGELQYCLKYHSITRVVEKWEQEKGTHFVGIAQNYKCFPSQRLTLEFSPVATVDADGDAIDPPAQDEYDVGEMPKLGLLRSRTSEGMDLGMDLLVEYKVVKDEQALRGMFDLVGTNFTWWWRDIVKASLMNTASLFRAEMFLGGESNRTVLDCEFARLLCGSVRISWCVCIFS